MFQPLPTTCFVVLRQAHLDQVAAAADALQDVLDVVRQRGDRLADGRQPLGLHHGGIVARVLDGQRRLMADGDHQLEMVFGEFVGRERAGDAISARAPASRCRCKSRPTTSYRPCIGTQIASRTPHATMLAAGSKRSSCRASLVSTPSLALHHVVENRLADRDLVVRIAIPLRSRRTFGRSCFVSGSKSMMQPRSASTHSKIKSMIRRSSWSMSSVWLTASAVRYMTCRLLRARASHWPSDVSADGRSAKRCGSLRRG